MIYAVAVLLLGAVFWRIKVVQSTDQFPIVKERSSDECGPTCLAMIAEYHGKEMPIDQLCEWMHILPGEGTSALDVAFAGKKLGLKVMAVKISLNKNEQHSLFDVPLPCILHWDGHYFVVLYKIKGNKFFIAHPRLGKIVFDKDEFEKRWIPEDAEKNEGVAILFEKRK